MAITYKSTNRKVGAAAAIGIIALALLILAIRIIFAIAGFVYLAGIADLDPSNTSEIVSDALLGLVFLGLSILPGKTNTNN